ncbi:unnamed protein product [Mucor hiemalis]
MSKVIDPSSLSNLDQIVTKHVHFNWTISFAEKKLVVMFYWTIVLDTSYLDIKSASINGQALQYTVADRHLSLGSALTITLPESIANAGTEFQLKVEYSTTDKCTAIQYLEPE